MQTRQIYKGSGFVIGLFLASALALQAAASKPVLTISTANPETLYNIAEKIATLGGTLDAFNESAAPFKELKGINPKNPIVFVLHAEGDEFKDPLLFLPITDLEKVEIPGSEFLLAQAKKESDGKYLLNSPAGAYVLTQKNGYLVASSESSEMPVPDDPAKFIADLEAYSLGIRIDVENTSAEAVQMLLAPFQLIAGMQGGEQALKMFEQINQSVEVMCNEARIMTVGITMDPKTGDVSSQYKMVAKKGSETEKQLAFLQGAKTIFGGFLGDENSVASFASLSMGIKDPTQREMTENTIDQIIEGVLEQVEENAEEDEDVELAEAIAKSAKKMILATLGLDRIDFAFSLGSDGTLALGTSLAEGQELKAIGSLIRKRLEKLSPEISAEAFKKMKTNDATVEGFQLSSFVFPFKELGAVEDGLPEFLADKTFYVYWGLKDDAFVLWSGFDPKSEEQFKSAIAATKTPVASTGASGFFSVEQLGKLLKDFQVDQLDGEAAVVVKALLQAGVDAKITFSQTADKDTLDQRSFISGKIWDAFSRIARGFTSSEADGSSNRTVRELN